jgi:Arc/MetJ-type ribon-helix-helix transcriptional regulator
MDRKLTVTIPSTLIEKIEAEVSEHGYESASDVVTLALIHWLEPVSENWPPSDADLRRLIDESLADPTEYTPEEVRQHFDERLAESTIGTRTKKLAR